MFTKKKKEPIKEEVFTDKWAQMGLKSKIEWLAQEKLNAVREQELKERKKKGRLFRLPFSIRLKTKNLATKNKVLVIYLRDNRNLQFRVEEVINGMVWLEGYAYNGHQEFYYIFNNKTPVLIIREDRINPIGPKDEYKPGDISYPEKIILRAIETKEAGMKKKLDSKILWIAIIAIAVVGYVLFGGK